MTLDVGTLAAYLTLDISGLVRGMATAEATVAAGSAKMAAAGEKAAAGSNAHAAALAKTTAEASKARKVVDDFVTAGVRTTTLGDALTGVRGKIAATEAAMSGLAARTTAAADAAKATSTKYEALATAGNKVAVTGLALGAAFVASQVPVTSFDAAMGKVRTGTQATGEALEGLRRAALDLDNAKLGFTATQAAEAITELGKAGVSTSDITGGALKGALALAAAGEMDVAQAAEVASATMVQFGKAGADVPHIADLLSTAADKALGSVSDMGMGMKYAGTVANSFGVSMEETVGVLAAFAAAGNEGEQGGTMFRSMLNSLLAPSDLAAKELDRLNINLYDSSGHFVGMAGAAGELRRALNGLSEAERNAALGKIFDTQAMQGAITMYKLGSDGVRKWTVDVIDAGHAERNAAILTDNLTGDLRKLGAALQVSLIEGGGGANGVLRGMVQGLTSAVTAVAGLPGPVVAAGGALTAFAAITLTLVGGVGSLVPKLLAARAVLDSFGLSGARLQAMLGPIGLLVTAASLAFGVWVKAQMDASAAAEAARGRVDALAGTFDKLTGALTEATKETLVKSLFDRGLIDRGRELGLTVETVTRAAMGQSDALREVDDATAAYVRHAAEAAAGGDDSASAMTHAEAMTREFRDSLVGTNDELNAARKRFGDAQVAADEVGKAMDGAAGQTQKVSASAKDAAKATKDFRDAVKILSDSILDERATLREYEQALDDAAASAKTYGKNLDVTTEAGRKNQAAIDDVVKTTWDHAAAMLTQGRSTATVTKYVEGAREAFIRQATAMTGSAEKAAALADELGLTSGSVQVLHDRIVGLPEMKRIGVRVDAEQALATVRALQGALAGIVDKDVTVRTHSIDVLAGSGVFGADGGIIDAYANGGIRNAAAYANGGIRAAEAYANGGIRPMGRHEDHTAQIARAGGIRIWAEPETGGEAYLPLSTAKRGTSIPVLEDVAAIMGFGLIPLAATPGAAAVSRPPASTAGARIGGGIASLEVHVHAAPGMDVQRLADHTVRAIEARLAAGG